MHRVHRSQLRSWFTRKGTPASGVGWQQRGPRGPPSRKHITVQGGTMWALHEPSLKAIQLCLCNVAHTCHGVKASHEYGYTASVPELAPLHGLLLHCVTLSRRDEAAWGISTQEQLTPKTLHMAVTCLTRDRQYYRKRGRRAAQLWVQICPL